MLSTPEAELIRALGGTKTVAKIAKVGESAISNYRRNGFPARLHYVLAKACQQKGIYVPDRLLGGKQTKWAGQPAKKADEDFVRDGLLNLFLQNNYEYIKTPILQPTDLFIARLGEKMRSRLYTLASPLRETLCLRPDLTIPTCRYYLDNHQKGTKRYCYQGIGFRYQDSHSKKPAEFIQTGIELIGGENDLQDDMEVVKLIGSAIETKQKNIYMQCSDMGLFSGLVFDLDLPERRKTQLIRYFCRSKNLFDGLLERLVAPLTKNTTKQTTKPIEKNQPTRQNLTDLDRLFQDYQNIISAEKNFPPLEKEIIQQIKTFTQLKESGENILPQLETFIPQFGKQYKKALSSFAKHLETFNRLNMVDIKKVRFSAMPDLKMAYYTGFMFSFSKNDILYGAGGRYDDLLEDLGGDVPIPAVGGAVFLDRLLEA